MINVLTNTKKFRFSKLELFDGKKFNAIGQQTISKLPSAILKLDNDIYAVDNLTIVSFLSEIDLLIEEELQKTIAFSGSHSLTIKKLRKLIASYDSKFQLGLEHVDLEMLACAKATHVKYKMLNKLHLKINKEVHND